ncbi:Heat shock 70 kDa protein 12B [Psilocybe cubensis]|uniref:Heat shock 70 kDa protein 12B n=2 Tax=Psilocybe cubensis TaxID=181762 RepID=A0ACB8HCT9_PSICU|nr:Heat shock 70 kDa protein 12B [Psilocybe cubensis]KAH9485815.1 Heat shock 70 kDa protein 12B [Psilocybe cubensis]
MASRSPYRGPRRKLVLAFDVGTTYSGISYSVLDPGQIPEIKGVTRFPAHEHISGASKIPTVIYYDRKGVVRAVGAEAMREGIFETAAEENWIKAEWFKLHLRSKVGAGKHVSGDIPPLPLNMGVVEVFADFLKYLFECASSYIQDTHANGVNLWASVSGHIDFVLSHPNGWEGTQQSEMRMAAVLAGLVPDTVSGHARLSFVTEGEASLHYAIHNGLPSGAMNNGDGVVIVDAGGGTIDISSYSKSSRGGKEVFEEIAAPQCHFHGSVFVTIHAKLFLENFLSDSPFADDVEHIVGCFDKTTKLRFRDAAEAQYIRFGSTRDNDANYNIRFGQLKLQGSDVALFFEPSVDCIVKAVLEQRKSAHKPISHVVLVGGFAASDWLFNKITEALTPSKLNIIRPENHVNKAVSDGAISFYLDHFVRTRVSKVTYGNFCHIPFDPTSPEHKLRSASTFMSVSGTKRISDSFDIILPKNTQVTEMKEFRKSYFRESEARSEFKAAVFAVWCYRGLVAEPRWKDVDTANYTKLCTIEIDLSNVPLSPRSKPNSAGVYYRLDYDIVLLFGLTELKAQVAWKEGNTEKRSAAKIVYDPDTTNDI